MRAQGYIEIDYKAMDDDEFEQFNTFLSQYMVHYKRVHQGTREYYFCIMRNVNLLHDLLGLMADRNPVLNGLWNQDGTAYGVTKTVDAETGEVAVSGDPEYQFDLDLHLLHTPVDVSIDEEGNVTETEVTEFKPLHGFFGWTLCTEY